MNQMLATLEMIAADRLGRALARHANGRLTLEELEVATRVDLVGALGISLSFISTDGD